MATTPKTLFRGAATTDTSTVLYTVPAATTAVVTSIVVTNTGNTTENFSLFLNDVSFATTITIGGLDATVIDIKQPLSASETIKGGASSTALNFHISGVEIV